jgi:glutaredoxin-related protein
VVAFVKGTRNQPQCGFSYKVLSMLNEVGANYEVLNVLDETYNPGLREAIKSYSQWPTIPQVLLFSANTPACQSLLTTKPLRLPPDSKKQ